MAEKDLAYYVEHPEEVDPTDSDLMAQLEALDRQSSATASDTAASDTKGAKAGEEGEEEEADPDDPEAVKAAEAKARAAAEAKAKADAQQAEAAAASARAKEEKPEGVASRDGKHVLPYSVLEEARQGRAGAEEALRSVSSQLLAANDRIKALQEGKEDPGAKAATTDDLDKLVEEVEAEAPWMGDAMRKVVTKLKELSEDTDALLAVRDNEEAHEQLVWQQRAREAESGNAILVLWKEAAPKLYAEAAELDQAIRENPAVFQRYLNPDGTPNFAKRYNALVEVVKANHAGEELPLPKAAAAPSAAAPASPSPKKTDLTTAAAEKLAKIAGDLAPGSLTDIAGGERPEGSELEKLERMTPQEIAAAFSCYTPDQMAAFMARTS